MNFKVLVFLALLVGGLFYLNGRQKDVERQQTVAYNGPLLGEASRSRVVEIRWDHVEAGRQVALEWKAGQWWITDPIEYPAATHRVNLILDALFRGAREVPGPDAEAVASHFDPPRIVITLFEQLEGGARRKYDLRVGAPDADGMQVEVERNGLYLRTLLNLDNALAVSVNDLRRTRIFDLHPDKVVEIERGGFSDVNGEMLDLAFHARREGPHWVQRSPELVQLDPSMMALMARVLCSLNSEGFVSDVVDPDLALYGLHMPNARIEMTLASGKSQELLLAQTPAGGWVVTRSDQRYVYAIPDGKISKLLDDWSALRDTRLLRAHRRDIAQVELTGGDRVVRLTQGPAMDDDWTVASKRAGDAAYGREWLASKVRVQEFLGFVEQTEVVSWLSPKEVPVASVIGADKPFARIAFGYRNVFSGEESSVLLGEVHTTEAGTRLRTFVRTGDGVVGLVPLALHDWANESLQGWRSRLVWDLQEGRLTRLRLTQGDLVREYKRKIQGTWTYTDMDTTPTEILPAMDHLVFLKAQEHLPDGEHGAFVDGILVEFLDADGMQHVAEIGLVEGGQVQLEVLGHRSVARNQDLYRLLSDVLQR